eukprot:g3368.t1
MASSGGGKPSFLAATGLSAEALAAKVLAEVIPEAATVPKAQVKDRRSTSQSRREPVGRRPESGAEEDISSNDVHEEVLQEEEDREEVVHALVTRWLVMLDYKAGITVQQILSLAVSLQLSPHLINTAVFTKEVLNYMANRFHLLQADEAIVFVWALQRLVVPGSSTAMLARGLHQVQRLWRLLSASNELSLPHGTRILETWKGSEAFWRKHEHLAEAVAKRMEELLLERPEATEIIAIFQAALSAPGLAKCLPSSAVEVLSSALLGRGPEEFERVQAVLAGSPWEILCQGRPRPGTIGKGSVNMRLVQVCGSKSTENPP